MLGIEVDKKRIFGLDLLRAFAIICVVHGHSAYLLAHTCLAPLSKIPLPPEVDIFFVLSGYLIGSSFLSYAQKFQKVDRRKTLRFYARSVFRILPNYYVILLAYIGLVSTGLVRGDVLRFPIWMFCTFTQNLFTPFYDFYWESWTLPVQWWFYILFPLLLTVASMWTNPRKITPYICLFFIAFSIVYRATVAQFAVDPFWWDVWLRKTVASRCDTVYIGVMAAWIKIYAPNLWNRRPVISFIAGLSLMTAYLFIPKAIGTVYTDLFSLTISPIAIALCLPFLSQIRSYKTLAGKAISILSVLSYAMFLTNLLILQFIDVNFADIFHNIGDMDYTGLS